MRYNKDFAFGMHLDDGLKDIYSHAYPLLNGGTINGTAYPGLYYTDGCGNDIPFKMSSAIYSFENGVDVHEDEEYADTRVTWEELNELYQAGWGVYNHGLTTSASGNYYYLVKRNHSYVKRKMLSVTPGGPEMKVFVCPNGNQYFTSFAFEQGYIESYRQYSFGVPSFDVTAIMLPDTLKMGRSNMDSGFDLSELVDNAASQSTNGAHHFGSAFSHYLTGQSGYPFHVFVAHMEYIAETYGKDGEDNIWWTTEEEVLEYLMLNQKITLNSNLIYKSLIITFDETEPLPTDFRFYASSLIINADAVIDDIIIDGGTNNTYHGIDTKSALVNLEWDGYVEVPDTVNAETYVSIAEQTQQQTDWNIAMDYVEIISPGPVKEAFRDRLCAIQGIVPPDGYCFCTTTAGPDTTICIGDSVQLTAGDGVSWEWNTGDTTQSIIVSPQDSSIFYVEVYNEAGCPATDTAEVGVAPIPVPEAGNDTTICSGDCAELSASGGETYLWSTGDTTQTIIVCPEDSAKYYVTVFSEFDCHETDSVWVFVNPSPEASAGEDTTMCNGGCATLTAEGNGSYLWNTGDTTQSIFVCPEDSSMYYVIVTNSHGCQDTDTVLVNINPLPFPVLTDDTMICRNQSVLLDASGGTNYLWSTGDTTSSIEVSPQDTTTYYVDVYNLYDCMARDSVKVAVAEIPNPVINSGNDTVICRGDCIELGISQSGNILWNTGQTADTIIVCPNETTTYYVDVINEYDCLASDTITVFVQNPPIINAGLDTTICQGNCATLNASGGEEYLWSNGDTTFWSVVCPAYDSMYYVTGYSGLGCSAKDSIIVFVNPAPDIEMTADTGVCSGDCLNLTASGGVSYLWITGDTTANITVCPEKPYAYYVEVKAASGCSAIDSTVVDIFPKPKPGLNEDTSVCQYSCIYLVAHDGTNYLWNDGSVNDSLLICPEENNSYFVEVTNNYGCKASDTTRVTTIPATEAYIYDLIPLYCNNEDSVILHAYPDGGTFSGEGVSNSGNNYYFNPANVIPGEINIIYKYTNEYDCPFYDTAAVTVNEQPYADLGGDTTVCNDRLFTLTAPPGFDTYLWWNGSTTNMTTFFPDELGEGIHTINLIITQNGCVYVAEKPLEVIICNPGINEYGDCPEFNIYPVPADDQIYLKSKTPYNKIDYQIIDIFGKTVAKGKLTGFDEKKNIMTIKCTTFENGIYMMILRGENFISIEKFVIQH